MKSEKDIPEIERYRAVAENITHELTVRSRFLEEVGLSYLTLDRRGDTLSVAYRLSLVAALFSWSSNEEKCISLLILLLIRRYEAR